MLYIATAMYIEAHPFIEYYHLKQNPGYTRFQVFASETVTLIITGTGELKASIALTYVLSQCELSDHDFFLNYGCCGSISDSILLDSTYICNKIKQQSTGHTVYPDLLDGLSFPESSITTCPSIVTKEASSLDHMALTEPLVDMEAFGLYNAAIYFFHTDQMLFLKTVTDHLEQAPSIPSQDVFADAVKHFAREYETVILPRLTHGAKKLILSKEERMLSDTITSMLHLSTTMRLRLTQHMIYYGCTHNDLANILQTCILSPEFSTCHSKSEGKRYFEQLLARLSD